MKTLIHKNLHVWDSVGGIALSDEDTKTLRHFADVDQCVNWLWQAGFKDAARAVNKRWKGDAA